MPCRHGGAVPSGSGTGHRLLERLLRSSLLPAHLRRSHRLSDDAGPGVPGGNPSVDWHGRGRLLPRLPLRSRRHPVRPHQARRLHGGPSSLSRERVARRGRALERVLPHLSMHLRWSAHPGHVDLYLWVYETHVQARRDHRLCGHGSLWGPVHLRSPTTAVRDQRGLSNRRGLHRDLRRLGLCPRRHRLRRCLFLPVR